MPQTTTLLLAPDGLIFGAVFMSDGVTDRPQESNFMVGL